jgi:A/G-specific adenine glycosylase
LSELRIGPFRRSLLAWYDEHRRDLPWRTASGSAPDPYPIWVSEVMLQQTRVETVRGYFERWMRRFPDLSTLAAAPEDEVLKMWEGLGYYSRARNLHRAAGIVRERYQGRVPADPAAFRDLPGVGAYTAGAVMSIAFGRPEPVVDGNVRRVFARILDDADPPSERLWQLAGRMARGPRPGDLNQALMELGALVCTPRNPACERCPARPQCQAWGAGTVRLRPRPRVARPLPTEHLGVAVVEHAGRFLVVRRPSAGRLAGLWEFPSTRAQSPEGAEAAAAAAAQRLGVCFDGLRSLPTVRHTLTHVRIVYHPFRGTTTARRASDECIARWAAPDELRHLAMSRAQRNIAAALLV